MTTRRKQSLGGAALAVLAVLFVALVVLSNTLLKGVRLDLTENDLYTISEGTENILTGLEEPINLYFFFSRKATEGVPYLRSYGARVEEMLEAFEDLAGDRLQLRVIDPLPFSEEEDQAAGFGLEAVTSGEGDPIYFGLAGTNAVDDVETIPFFQPDREAFLEYDLARLVWSLANPERPVVGLVSSLPMTRGFDPQLGRQREPWIIINQIRQLFELKDLGSDPADIDPDVDLLLVVHPKNLGDSTLYAIDQFVMGGGKLVAFVDPQADMESPDPLSGAGGGTMPGRASEMNRLFEAWGFEADDSSVVADLGNALMVNTGAGTPVRHLAMIGLGESGIADDDVVTAQLESVNLGTAGHIVAREDGPADVSPLLLSSDQSMLFAASRMQFLSDPSALLDEFVPTGERYVLAARVEGELPSAFPDGPPEGVDTGGREHLAASVGEVSMVVVADTDILADRLWVQVRSLFGQRLATAFADNGTLVTNALENLAGSQDLISVRSRGSFTRPFERVEALRREAEARFRAQEQRLEAELDETERKLAELQSAREDQDVLLLSEEQEAELARFTEENLRIRGELREVRRELDASIERLGDRLRMINIGLVPALVAVIGLLAAAWRTRQRRRAEHSR
ncbi:MAG: Gldg family protein [Gammaproteobacteria bacterium]